MKGGQIPIQNPPVINPSQRRGLLGNKDWIADHSKFVKSKRAIHSSINEEDELLFQFKGNPVYEYATLNGC